jgi:hypothetical protein
MMTIGHRHGHGLEVRWEPEGARDFKDTSNLIRPRPPELAQNQSNAQKGRPQIHGFVRGKDCCRRCLYSMGNLDGSAGDLRTIQHHGTEKRCPHDSKSGSAGGGSTGLRNWAITSVPT